MICGSRCNFPIRPPVRPSRFHFELPVIHIKFSDEDPQVPASLVVLKVRTVPSDHISLFCNSPQIYASMATNELGFTPAQELQRKEEDRTNQLRAILYSLIALSTIAVILRLLSRRVGKIRLWWDDFLTIAALVGRCHMMVCRCGADIIFVPCRSSPSV